MIGEVFAMDESFRKDTKLPEHYRHVGYWALRLTIAVFGGGLAAAYEVHNPIAALQIGASAPLIYDTLSKNSKV